MHMIKCSALALAIGAVSQAAWADAQVPAAQSRQAQANGLVEDSRLNILARE
ncbi:hypothetical protein P8H27_08395 [Pseudomonas sp. sp1636]|uniref:hypothetical protein n=1 Tax=Pseudomonas sp. sp1636 TaxID=3036707 RepID=UPI0025A4DC1B|nr:hypothetical protein [Pseudomonas sp. sp1636]MDM8348921.1 hypothetical protein [Pseudomonas sp. sp1636]